MKKNHMGLWVIQAAFFFLISTLSISSQNISSQAEDKDQRDQAGSAAPQRVRYRTGVLGSSFLGTSGGFTVIDGETLYKGKYLFGSGFNSFGRPGQTRIFQVSYFGAYGFTERLEGFFSLTVAQGATIGAPSRLSGSLLSSALIQSPAVSRAPLLNALNNGFFPLPGLQVSGAMVGGVLPGIPIGPGQPFNDPVIGGNKTAFTTPSFLNDYPFLGRRGASFGDLILGGKYRLGSKKKNEKKSDPGTASSGTPQANSSQQAKGADKTGDEDAQEIFSNAIFAYIKLPYEKDGGIFNIQGGNRLFRGAGSGTIDLGIFYTTSNYLELPVFGKKKTLASPDDAYCPALDGPTPPGTALGSGKAKEYTEQVNYSTLNVHTNHGFIRNGDPSANGRKLIDRRDAFIFAYGVDTMLTPQIQALAEFRSERMIGGGTPNLSKYNPVELTFGGRFYTKPVPGFRAYASSQTQDTKFFSVGLAYRLSLSSSRNFGQIGSSKHNFLVQLNFGNTRKRGVGDVKTVKTAPVECENVTTRIEKLTIDKSRVRQGEKIKVTPVYSANPRSRKEIYWFVNGVLVPGMVDADGDPTGDLEYTVNLSPRSDPYKIRFVVQTEFRKFGAKNATAKCPCDEQTIDLYVTEPVNENIELEPNHTVVSAQREQTTNMKAVVLPADQGFSLDWKHPEQFRLNGTPANRSRQLTTPAGLTPGTEFDVTVETSGSQSRISSNAAKFRVNNPPGVDLGTTHPDLTSVSQADSVDFFADGEDADEEDIVRYSWKLTGRPFDNSDVSPDLLRNIEQNSGQRIEIPQNALKPGDYVISVTASDGLDSTMEEKAFSVVRPSREIYFRFNEFKLREKAVQDRFRDKDELINLRKEVQWLKENIARTIVVRIEGNADRVGCGLYNYWLGCQRARTIRDYFAKAGIPESQIKIIVSRGEESATVPERASRKARRPDRNVRLTYFRVENKDAIALREGDKLCPERSAPKPRCRKSGKSKKR